LDTRYVGGEKLTEKIACEIKCIETEDGLRIEVKGEQAKNYIERMKKGEVSFPCCGCC
jgi:hypothetical protein